MIPHKVIFKAEFVLATLQDAEGMDEACFKAYAHLLDTVQPSIEVYDALTRHNLTIVTLRPCKVLSVGALQRKERP